MHDLSSDLRHLISFYAVLGTNVDEAISDIKQTFIDDGWLPPDHDQLKQIEKELRRLDPEARS